MRVDAIKFLPYSPLRFQKKKRVTPKNTLSTSMWLARAAPAVGPNPEIIFKTPEGSPACNIEIHMVNDKTCSKYTIINMQI